MGRIKDVLIQFAELLYQEDPAEEEAFLHALSTGDLRGPSIEEPITLADLYDCWEDTHTIPRNLDLGVMVEILEGSGEIIIRNRLPSAFLSGAVQKSHEQASA